MANLSTEEEYKSNNYFNHRHGGDKSEEHCVGNSCDNLIGLAKPGPAPHLELPEVHPQPVMNVVQKPARSEVDNNAVSAAVQPRTQHDHPVYDHSGDAEDFARTEYYSELRRRSLEGRAPLRFSESGEHPVEENLASEEFDVALY